MENRKENMHFCIRSGLKGLRNPHCKHNAGLPCDILSSHPSREGQNASSYFMYRVIGIQTAALTSYLSCQRNWRQDLNFTSVPLHKKTSSTDLSEQQVFRPEPNWQELRSTRVQTFWGNAVVRQYVFMRVRDQTRARVKTQSIDSNWNLRRWQTIRESSRT